LKAIPGIPKGRRNKVKISTISKEEPLIRQECRKKKSIKSWGPAGLIGEGRKSQISTSREQGKNAVGQEKLMNRRGRDYSARGEKRKKNDRRKPARESKQGEKRRERGSPALSKICDIGGGGNGEKKNCRDIRKTRSRGGGIRGTKGSRKIKGRGRSREKKE